MSKISLQGLDKGEVLAALYNASRHLGMGFLQYDPTPMTAEEGSKLLAYHTYFDYLKGRVMKIDLKGDELETWLYDRDNGPGAAEKVISELRKSKSVNTASMQDAHKSGVVEAAADAQALMGRDHTVTVTKIHRKFDKDGKVVEETIETTDDPKKAEEVTGKMSAEMDKTFGKMNKFFDKMNEAFKELF